jgi:hypothetical protein
MSDAIPASVARDPHWIQCIDILYSHTLLWNDVPGRSAAVAVWMDRLVAFEVRRHFLCVRQVLTLFSTR